MDPRLEVKLRKLAAREFETGDMLAASGAPLERFKQWAARGGDFAENPKPGSAQRRRYRLWAGYAYRGITVLGEQSGIGPQDGAEIMRRVLFPLYYSTDNNISLDESREQYLNVGNWPDYMLQRDSRRQDYAIAYKSAKLGWLAKVRSGSESLDEIWSILQRPTFATGETPEIFAVACLKLTDTLIHVDDVLSSRR